MTIITIRKPGDLLNATEPYIAQQANCLTMRAHGLAATIAKRFPRHGNYYSTRTPLKPGANTATEKSRDIPGTIHITPSESEEPSMVMLFGQWAPGAPNSRWIHRYPVYVDEHYETASDREHWFQLALDALDDVIPSHEQVAIPWGIGCGLARGNWRHYQAMLEQAKTSFVVYALG
jgi:hypothetical protein